MILSIFEEELSKSEPRAQEKTVNDRVAEKTHKLLEIEVLKTAHAFDVFEEEWNQLLEKSDAHIFQTYEWQHLWWKFFGNKCQMHIVNFRANGKLVGIAPMVLDEIRWPGIGVHRTLQFMGSYIPVKGLLGLFANYSPSDYLEMIVDKEYREDVAWSFIHYLERNKSFIDQVVLDELTEDGFTMQYVIPKIEETSWIYEQQKNQVCPRIELPDTVRDYLYMVKTSFRHKLRRSRRPVTEDNLYKVCDVDNDQEFEKVFQNLVHLHQERWNKQGYPGVFMDERYERFIKSVCKAFLRKNWLKMKSAFDHDGNCLAVDLAFSFKDQYYDYQKALDVTSELAKESPGHALTYFLIEDAINEKKKVFDLLRGVHRYKQRLSTTEIQNWKVTIQPQSHKQGLIVRLARWRSQIYDVKLRILQELLVLYVHIKEWGVPGFLSRYISFIKSRFKNKH